MTFRSPLESQQRTRRAAEPVRAYAAMNTMRALERLVHGPVSAPELAEHLEVAPRTARRILRRLELEGYAAVCADTPRRYRATLRLAALGRRAIDHDPLIRAAGPIVAALARTTRAAAHLWIPLAPDVCCVLHAASDGTATPAAPMLGRRSSAWANAGGRALVAYQPDFAAAVVADRLDRQDGASAADSGTLATEVRRVRSDGYATLRDERQAAVTSVAAVVRLEQQAVAALGVSLGDGSRPTADIPAHVMRAADRLSDELRETRENRESHG